MKEYCCYVKRGLTDPVSRELIINNDYITFQEKNFRKDNFTTFFKSEITDYRFGIYWLQLDLTFGRQYQIFIRNKENKTLKITFKSYFRYKLKQINNQYHDILDALWKFHFDNITDDYLQRFENEETFSIGNVRFSTEGISISGKNIIPWEDIRTSNHYSYFAIYSEKDPININSQHSYMEDWNTTVLYSTLRTILSYKNIESYN